MMEFLATNFNLPTIIVGAIVFGGVGWATWHSHKHGGCGGCGEGGCNGIKSGAGHGVLQLLHALAAAAATDR